VAKNMFARAALPLLACVPRSQTTSVEKEGARTAVEEGEGERPGSTHDRARFLPPFGLPTMSSRAL
jgi:hypothetical protein